MRHKETTYPKHKMDTDTQVQLFNRLFNKLKETYIQEKHEVMSTMAQLYQANGEKGCLLYDCSGTQEFIHKLKSKESIPFVWVQEDGIRQARYQEVNKYLDEMNVHKDFIVMVMMELSAGSYVNQCVMVKGGISDQRLKDLSKMKTSVSTA